MPPEQRSVFDAGLVAGSCRPFGVGLPDAALDAPPPDFPARSLAADFLMEPDATRSSCASATLGCVYNHSHHQRCELKMGSKPILIGYNSPLTVHVSSVRDEEVLDEDLPAVLERDSSGYVLARATLQTEVARETHDDK